ncbi:hypothetical protein [Staphylococcus caprae]|uniref:hypothetical protein n=1 Tax=Staphylococcus caprae TaxID=29380 RepID=UPI0014523D6A|nr:hypothetical protein [Staphylococcus caprae]QJE26637.1 hypothetical protein HHJ99_12770 [Staphylococcus caprae]QJE26702.1 hypothetical protein HHJ99_13100 [Staphylococcus caprae]
MRYEEILEQIKQADLENVPNHEIEATDFTIEDAVNGKEYTFSFDINQTNEIMDMQVYVTGALEFPVGETYNLNSYDASEGNPLPKLGDIISDEGLAEAIHETL